VSKQKLCLYFVAGLCLGLGLGFGVGVLQAPDSGDRTRRKFIKKAGRFKDSVTKSLKKSNHSVQA